VSVKTLRSHSHYFYELLTSLCCYILFVFFFFEEKKQKKTTETTTTNKMLTKCYANHLTLTFNIIVFVMEKVST